MAAFFPDGFPKVVELSNMAEERGVVSVSVRGTLKIHVRYSEALFLDPCEVSQCHSISVRFFVELKE